MRDRRPSVEMRELRYKALWGRPCAQIFHQTNDEDPHVDIYRYDPTWRFWAPARDVYVYATGGMADRPMPVGAVQGSQRAERIELCAYTQEIVDAAPGRDAAAWVLHTLAHMPWREQISFMPLETVGWGDVSLLDDSAMTALFFIIPPVDEGNGLSRAAEAELTLQVMTITSAERDLAVREGSIALVDRLEAAGVAPLIDWKRASCV